MHVQSVVGDQVLNLLPQMEAHSVCFSGMEASPKSF